MSGPLKQIVLFAVCTLALVWIASRMMGNLIEAPSVSAVAAVGQGRELHIIPAATANAKSSSANSLRSLGTAPDPEVLRGDAELQAAYDSGARPGDFVTPPAVSVDH